jgi:hypothetical protein
MDDPNTTRRSNDVAQEFGPLNSTDLVEEEHQCCVVKHTARKHSTSCQELTSIDRRPK